MRQLIMNSAIVLFGISRVKKSQQKKMFSDGDDDYVCTPAEHIGSLQLSAKPMLVPETVDEME